MSKKIVINNENILRDILLFVIIVYLMMVCEFCGYDRGKIYCWSKHGALLYGGTFSDLQSIPPLNYYKFIDKQGTRMEVNGNCIVIYETPLPLMKSKKKELVKKGENK